MKKNSESLYAGKCAMRSDDATLKKRKEIAERLKRGESVVVEGNTGRMTEDDKNIPENRKLKINKTGDGPVLKDRTQAVSLC